MENKRSLEVLQKYSMGHVINLYKLSNKELLEELSNTYKTNYLWAVVNAKRKIYSFNIYKKNESYMISVWMIDSECIIDHYTIKEDKPYEPQIDEIYEKLVQFDKGYRECSNCNRVIKPEEKTYWYPYTGVACKECNVSQEVIDKRKEAMEMLD